MILNILASVAHLPASFGPNSIIHN